MTLRRLRLHGLVQRIPKSHRYRVTDFGLRVVMFFTRAYTRIFRRGLAIATPDKLEMTARCATSFDHLQNAIDAWCDRAHLAA